MKKIVITLKILIVVVSISAFVFIFAFNDETEKQIALKLQMPEKQLQSSKAAPELAERKNTFYIKPELVPSRLSDFYTMSSTERLNRVTEMMEDKRLSFDIVEFFKAELFNRSLSDTTRNNMAHALVRQHKAAPDLHKLFIKMLDGEDENEVWRDYCLQYLALCYNRSNDKSLIIRTMFKAAKGNDSKAGTAIKQLVHLEKHNNVNLGPNFSKLLASQLEAPETHIFTKATILGMIGRRGDKSLLPLLRKYARHENAILKAKAISSLGLIGDKSDLNLIAEALNHQNRMVQLAANAGFSKIQKREQQMGIKKQFNFAKKNIAND